MLQTLQVYSNGFIYVLNQFAKGKYGLFFLPGLIVSLFFGFILFITDSISNLDVFIISETSKFLGLIITQIYIFFILTLLAPFNTALSEKFEKDYQGKEYIFKLDKFFKDLLRMIVLSFVLILIEFTLLGIIWMVTKLFHIPYLNELTFLIISSLFIGYSFFDPSLERHRYGISKSLQFFQSNLFTILIAGLFFQLIFHLPYLGILISPVITTLLATYVFLNLKKQ